MLPGYLYHYYDAAIGPFVNLSDLPPAEAEALLAGIRQAGATFASRRGPEYLNIRRELETRVRQLFAAKGGRPVRGRPHYMTLGPCPWLLEWYREGRAVRIPLSAFDPATVSFTYGDTFPAMRYGDGKPYRGRVFTLDELPALVAEYGLPQVWNPEGSLGPDRYVEAQVWVEPDVGWLDVG